MENRTAAGEIWIGSDRILPRASRRRWTSVRPIFLCLLTVVALDILYAVLAFRWFNDVPGLRMLGDVTQWLIGPEDCGNVTMPYILLLYLCFTFGVVTPYHLASRRLTFLTCHPLIAGPLYGLLVYVIIHQAVVALSVAPLDPPELPVLLGGLLNDALGLGLPCALFMRGGGKDER